jgi:hypothetical protein
VDEDDELRHGVPSDGAILLCAGGGVIGHVRDGALPARPSAASCTTTAPPPGGDGAAAWCG